MMMMMMMMSAFVSDMGVGDNERRVVLIMVGGTNDECNF